MKQIKLDVDKLVTVLVDLSKLSDVPKNDLVEKEVQNATRKKILKAKYLTLLT